MRNRTQTDPSKRVAGSSNPTKTQLKLCVSRVITSKGVLKYSYYKLIRNYSSVDFLRAHKASGRWQLPIKLNSKDSVYQLVDRVYIIQLSIFETLILYILLRI